MGADGQLDAFPRTPAGSLRWVPGLKGSPVCGENRGVSGSRQRTRRRIPDAGNKHQGAEGTAWGSNRTCSQSGCWLCKHHQEVKTHAFNPHKMASQRLFYSFY